MAQIEKGTISLLPEINVSVNQYHTNSSKTYRFSTFIRPGFFVLKNLAVNADIGILFRYINRFEFIRSSAVLGGGVTYMIPISKKFYVPTFIGYNYSTSNSDVISNSTTTSSLVTSVFLAGAGIEYLVADRLGVRFSLVNNFTTSFTYEGLRGFFGVNLYFARMPK